MPTAYFRRRLDLPEGRHWALRKVYGRKVHFLRKSLDQHVQHGPARKHLLDDGLWCGCLFAKIAMLRPNAAGQRLRKECGQYT